MFKEISFSQGEGLEQLVAYWREQLHNAPSPLPLPADHPRPAQPSYRGATYRFSLSADLSAALRTLSRQENCTLFMTLLAAVQMLLARYSGEEDIVIGTPSASRTHSELEPLIGYFVNMLVLRSDLSGNPTVREVLARVREVTLGAYAHQELPFDLLVQHLNPMRDARYPMPLFQVAFQLLRSPDPASLPQVRLESMEVETGTAKFDLNIEFEDTPQGLKGMVEYSTELFEASTIQRLAGHLQQLLTDMIVNPEQRMGELSLLTSQEREQLLVEWNRTQVDYPADHCLHQLFEAQADRSPNAVAVIFEQEQLTYGELNQRANQLAHHLQRLAVGPDMLVGLCMERSLDLIVALLGILKAGGAYIPLDPDYPQERLAFMLQDAQVPILLTQSYLLKRLSAVQAQLLCLDTDWPLIAQASTTNPQSGVQPHQLAYVIYTSGSTGKPKAAMNTHRGICNRLFWIQDAHPLTVLDCVLQKTPITFDISVWEFFWPLMVGAQLVVARPNGHKDVTYLEEVLATQKITTVHFVPSMLQIFLQEARHHVYPHLHRVICSGEALSFELQERFFACFQAELLNLYGPTEAAVEVTSWTCKREVRQRIVPIGHPIANMQIYILDQHLQPVPIGIPGELHIGGVGLARGYLNRPELTAEKFIAHPFSQEPGARLYKTGDLARYMPDGNIEFLGRLDHQVKLRGFRIELGEIKSALCQHPAIQEAVVLLREDIPGDKHLVAYLVFVPGQQVSPDDLRRFLQEHLPNYMVPSHFVMLEQLPLGPNGKLDRRALPAPEQSRPGLDVGYVAPRTPVEELLAGIWVQVLKVDRVGIHDNFFNLGGDSLKIISVYVMLKNSYPQLTLQPIFNYTTIAELAEFLVKDDIAPSPGFSPETRFSLLPYQNITVSDTHNYDTVLLTGATGYLGAHLLNQILKETEASIYCLVRATSKATPEERLASTLKFYFGDEGIKRARERIIAIEGDLDVDGLGMTVQVTNELLRKIDTIFHCGADVRHYGSSSHLENTNTNGTARILRLAQEGLCRMHYLSTLSIVGLAPDDPPEITFSEHDFDRGQRLLNVYNRSKFHAERLIHESIAQGLPISIYRMGSLVGDSQSGQFQYSIGTNEIYRILKAILILGVAPIRPGHLDLTPIDYCIRALIHLAKRPDTVGNVFHLCNPEQITLVEFYRILQSLGYKLHLMELEQFENWLFSPDVLAVHRQAAELLAAHLHEDGENVIVHFDCETTMKYLDGITCPKPDLALMKRLVNYAIAVGYLPPYNLELAQKNGLSKVGI